MANLSCRIYDKRVVIRSLVLLSLIRLFVHFSFIRSFVLFVSRWYFVSHPLVQHYVYVVENSLPLLTVQLLIGSTSGHRRLWCLSVIDLSKILINLKYVTTSYNSRQSVTAIAIVLSLLLMWMLFLDVLVAVVVVVVVIAGVVDDDNDYDDDVVIDDVFAVTLAFVDTFLFLFFRWCLYCFYFICLYLFVL